jgi:hypothetical protein
MRAISMSEEAALAGILLTIEQPGMRPISTRLDAGVHRIGTALDNDIVLLDEQLDDRHLVLEIARPVRLSAITGTVHCADGLDLAPGALRLHGDGVLRFAAGGSSFRLDLPVAAAAPARSRLKGLVIALFCLAAFMAAVGSTAAPRLNAAPIVRVAAALPLAVPKLAPDSAQILPTLRARLGQSNIETIDLTMLPDGSIRAGGRIAPDQETAWRDVEHWFDGTYAGQAVLVDHVEMAATIAPLTVQAARPGADGYVIDGDGNKLYVGAVVKDGWQLASIGGDRLLLRRDAQTLSVRF